jgi:phage shock protein A
MNLLERVLTLLRANLNTVVEKSDDPDKTLKQLQLDMRNQLVQVKTEVAKAIAEGHMLQKRGQIKKAEADVWLKKAEYAVQQGNDTSAREALQHYNTINKIVQRYQQQKKEQEHLVNTLRTVLLKLEEKIAEADTTIELLTMNKRNTFIQQRVFEALQKKGPLADRTHQAQEIRSDSDVRSNRLDLHNQPLGQPFELASIEQQLQQIKEELRTSSQNISDYTSLSKEQKSQSTQLTPQTGPLTHPYVSASDLLKKREKPQSRRSQTPDEVSKEKNLDLEYLKTIFDTPPDLD